MKHLFRLIAVTLGLPFLALPLFAQQNRVVDPNNPPVVAQGATNVPLSLDTFGRLLVNSGNPTGSAPYRIGQTNVTLSLDGRGRVLTNDVGGGGGGSGTVTSFSAGNLSPLFSTSVATATTTPALSFSLSSQSANRVFAGPTTGADAAPTFRALVNADVPAGGSNGQIQYNNGGLFSGLTYTALGVTTGSTTIAWGTMRTVTQTGDLTITSFTGTESAGAVAVLYLVADGTHSITFPASYRNGLTHSTSTTFTPTAGTYTLQFSSLDGAGTYLLTDTVLTGAIPIANGGTGATTSYGAYDALSGAETTVASASTTDLGAVTSNKVSITGTTTITSFGTAAAGVQRWGRFTGALTLTYNATSLILPGASNITTVAGDSFHAVSLGSGNWVVYNYTPVSGKAVVKGWPIYLRQGNNGFTVAAAATAYIGFSATATGQQGRYKETIRYAGTITDYTFSYYGGGGGANACTVTLLLNGVTTVGSTTIAGNVFPSSVTVTGLSQAVAVGDTIEVTFLNHASNASITSFIGGATVTVK